MRREPQAADIALQNAVFNSGWWREAKMQAQQRQEGQQLEQEEEQQLANASNGITPGVAEGRRNLGALVR